MADHEEKKEPIPRGNEWEVVSLTSSAYAATPSSELVDANADMAYRIGKDEAMFMSGHFVFPPSQHENLPLEPEEVEVQNVPEIAQSSSRLEIKEEPREFDNLIEKDQSMNTDLKYSSFYGETTCDENTFIVGQMEPSEELLDSDMLNSSNKNKNEDDDEYDSYKLPSEAWWKRGAFALYSQAKEANTFWTICVAAAVMGLVVMGRRLHQEKLEVLHLKWRLSIDSEKMKKLLGPISRSKEVKL